MKYSAEELSRAGDQFLGRAYSEMDCQEFIERCLQAIGIREDLRGSNAWFREMTWTGTPEECVRTFGSVPRGAFLFILENDGGEIARGYHDGRGNASHIGMKTGRGKGAIHSSSSRGCVAESEFHDRTIRNGGWNRVGLWDRLDYGKSVNWLLEHGTGGAQADDEKEEGMPLAQAIARSENGGDINLRKKPDGDLLGRVPSGSAVEILEGGETWSKIRWKGKTGWMMSRFLEADESGIPDEDSGTEDQDEPRPGETVTIVLDASMAAEVYWALQDILGQIAEKIGRG